MSKIVSVQPIWMIKLPIQQQSVLFLASRGPDGISKNHPIKNIVRAYRGTVIVAAKFGRPLYWGEKGDTFACLERFSYDDLWREDLRNLFDNIDSLPHHYIFHLAHGAEILGYKHPDVRFAIRWNELYREMCKDNHVNPETEEQMDKRLADWERKDWDV